MVFDEKELKELKIMVIIFRLLSYAFLAILLFDVFMYDSLMVEIGAGIMSFLCRMVYVFTNGIYTVNSKNGGDTNE